MKESGLCEVHTSLRILHIKINRKSLLPKDGFSKDVPGFEKSMHWTSGFGEEQKEDIISFQNAFVGGADAIPSPSKNEESLETNKDRATCHKDEQELKDVKINTSFETRLKLFDCPKKKNTKYLLGSPSDL